VEQKLIQTQQQQIKAQQTQMKAQRAQIARLTIPVKAIRVFKSERPSRLAGFVRRKRICRWSIRKAKFLRDPFRSWHQSCGGLVWARWVFVAAGLPGRSPTPLMLLISRTAGQSAECEGSRTFQIDCGGSDARRHKSSFIV